MMGRALAETRWELSSWLLSQRTHLRVRIVLSTFLLATFVFICARGGMLLEYFSYHQYILIVFTIPMVTAVHAMQVGRPGLYATASVLIHVAGAAAILCNVVYWTDPNRKRNFDNFIVHGANMIIMAIEILLNRLHPRPSYASFGVLSLLLYVLIIVFPMYATRSRWIYSQIDPKYSSRVAIVVFYLCMPLG
mmetsp:Transcript_16591/g.68060  ORF Transcript_16591/g.68060 Transcript_16591/m.68060 type:complete len:192 (-) Transcript_16591:737-1312(-)